MATHAPTPNIRQWTRSRLRLAAGWQIVPYNESTGRYRINQYLGTCEQPFYALIVRPGQNNDQISRHATLDEAKAACEQHLRAAREQHRQAPQTNGAARFNEAGDPLPRKFWE